MNSRDQNMLWFAVICVCALVVLAVVIWFSQALGVDKETAATVLGRLVIVAGLLAGGTWLFTQVYPLRWSVPLYPAGIYWAFWPAFNYWSASQYPSFITSQNPAWYAVGWVQLLMLLSILALGYGIVYLFSDD